MVFGDKNPAKRPDVRKKISDARRGKKRPPFSDKWRRNLSLALKGKNTWSRGKKLSKEHKKRIILGLIGRKHSEETKQKMHKAQLGENGSNWKGGITPLNDWIRSSFKYRQWRSDVFTRDNFTCQECNQLRGEIESHHLQSLSSLILKYKIKTLEEAENCQEIWNINNGKTLCHNCHKKTDSYAGKNNH
jgi:hypothetical protein